MEQKNFTDMMNDIAACAGKEIEVECVELEDEHITPQTFEGMLWEHAPFKRQINIEDEHGIGHLIPFFGKACFIKSITVKGGDLVYVQDIKMPEALSDESEWRTIINGHLDALGGKARESFLLP